LTRYDRGVPVIEAHRDGARVARVVVDDDITIGRSPRCTVVLDDPAVAEVHATIRIPDAGDDVALYLQPGASAIVAGDVVRGRYALWSPACVFSIGPFVIHLTDVLHEVPTDFTIDLTTSVATETPGRPTPRYEPAGGTESLLVATLRERPADDAIREVYADWLEEHGFDLRARLLRAETEAARPDLDISVRVDTLAPAPDHPWRAIASRAPIERCIQLQTPCPKRWSSLAPTADDRVRHCATCEQPVYYCASVDEARMHGRLFHCIAIDAAVARGEALAAYDEDNFEMGEIAEDV
jgi:uncharacterized protein (TIGR02996 family)